MRLILNRLLTRLFPLPRLQSKTSLYKVLIPPSTHPADLLAKVEAGQNMAKPQKPTHKEKKIRLLNRKTV